MVVIIILNLLILLNICNSGSCDILITYKLLYGDIMCWIDYFEDYFSGIEYLS